MTLHYQLVLVATILFTLLIKTCFPKQCIESFSTIKEVKQCPVTEEAWLHAAKRKRCDALAKVQTCVPEPERFMYHCLVNQWENGTVEVCAPVWILTGYCGYYDTEIGKIVNDVKKDCTTFDDPCPPRYNSSESFKYPKCFDVKRRKENTGQGCKSSTDSQNDWMIVAIILAGGSCIVIAVICWWSRKTSGKFEFLHHERDQNSQEQARVNGEESLPLTNEPSDASAVAFNKEDILDDKRTSADIIATAVYVKEIEYQAKPPTKNVFSSGSSNYINSDLLDTATSDGMETDKGETALSESYPRMPDTYSSKKKRRRKKKNKHHIDDFRVKGKGGKH